MACLVLTNWQVTYALLTSNTMNHIYNINYVLDQKKTSTTSIILEQKNVVYQPLTKWYHYSNLTIQIITTRPYLNSLIKAKLNHFLKRKKNLTTLKRLACRHKILWQRWLLELHVNRDIFPTIKDIHFVLRIWTWSDR